LEHGADPQLKDENGRTALDWANTRDRSDAAQILKNPAKYRANSRSVAPDLLRM
ncbi:MAG: hypothetical protein QOJ65_883, partial [Fimbriimonadaceae bacterium]|nr:hypothetical protein [Fimbriimonadaceae bacterium]